MTAGDAASFAAYDVAHPLGVDVTRTAAQLRAIADGLEAGAIWLTEVRHEYMASATLVPSVELCLRYGFDRARGAP